MESPKEKPDASPSPHDGGVGQNILSKLNGIELLPDVFELLQRVESGELKSQDFDNHAGSVRVKLHTIRQYLQEVDGVCETIDERQSRIRLLADCNESREWFLADFRRRVRAGLPGT